MELCPPLYFGVVAIEKGAFASPSTRVANFSFISCRTNPKEPSPPDYLKPVMEGIIKGFVAVIDLFSFVNQCPCQAIRPHTDQSVAECIDSFFRTRTIFSSPFWKSRQVREHSANSKERSLSRTLLRTFHMEDLHWRARCYKLHTEESALRLVTRVTCYSDTPPTNSRTNILTGDTKKNLFSLWLVYFC